MNESVLLRDEHISPPETFLRFRLYYEGQFFAARDDLANDKRLKHKHHIRSVFHNQLKDLWSERKFLKDAKTSGQMFGICGETKPLAEKLEEISPKISGFKFIPLVHESFDLTCSLNVLLMRRDRPGDGRLGRIFDSRDIDNRLKVLFDALKMPVDVRELGGVEPCGDGSDNPMYVLLQKDELVTKVCVETDDLLAPPERAGRDDSYARVLIDVNIGLWNANMFNLGLHQS